MVGSSGVEELPSLQLEVRTSATAQNKQGMFVGSIHLVCVTRDEAIFDAAVQQLDGYKMYGSVSEEVIQALAAELHAVEEAGEQTRARINRLERLLHEKEARIARLEHLLSTLGMSLGLGD